MRFENYESWFRIATGHEAPRKWQTELASDAAVRNRLIRVPTGMGKTLGVLLAWAYHRLQRNDKQWPARLVWFSAIRTLIEQAQLKTTEIVDRLLHGTRYFVYVAMRPEIIGIRPLLKPVSNSIDNHQMTHCENGQFMGGVWERLEKAE